MGNGKLELTFEDDVVHLKLVPDGVGEHLRDLWDVAVWVVDRRDGHVDRVDDHRAVVHDVEGGGRLEAELFGRAVADHAPEVGVLEVETHLQPVEVGVDLAVVGHGHALVERLRRWFAYIGGRGEGGVKWVCTVKIRGKKLTFVWVELLVARRSPEFARLLFRGLERGN